MKDNNFVIHNIEWNGEKIARIWDFYSTHKPYSDQYFTKNFGNDLLKNINKIINLQGKSILDFGSGPGFFLEVLYNNRIKCDYYALDFSEKSIEKIYKQFNSVEILKNAKYVSHLPSDFEDGQFDVILSFEVIEHLNENQFEDMLREVNRLLKPGGFLILTTPNKEDLSLELNFCPDCGCTYHKWQHMSSWNSRKLDLSLMKIGVKSKYIIETEFFDKRNSIVKRYFKSIINKIKKQNSPHLFYIGVKK